MVKRQTALPPMFKNTKTSIVNVVQLHMLSCLSVVFDISWQPLLSTHMLCGNIHRMCRHISH